MFGRKKHTIVCDSDKTLIVGEVEWLIGCSLKVGHKGKHYNKSMGIWWG